MHRRLVWITCVCAGVAAFGSRLSAQTPAHAPAQPPTRVAAAQSATPTASQNAAAAELFKTLKLQSSITNTTEAMIDSEIGRNPGMAPYRDVMLNWLKKYMTWDSMLPELTKLYTETYTDAELKELNTFYKTPIGQKSLVKMPELMQKTAMIGAKLGQAHAEELKALMNARREELVKEQEKAQAQAAKTPGGKTPAPVKPSTPAPKKP
jgi:uncharacterized protein